MITIIDELASPPPTTNPIKLIGCLQSTNTDGKFSFGTQSFKGEFPEWPRPYEISEIKRVFSMYIDGIEYSVMVIKYAGGVSEALFIGEWNDGTMK